MSLKGIKHRSTGEETDKVKNTPCKRLYFGLFHRCKFFHLQFFCGKDIMKAYTYADMRSADKYTIEVLGVPGTELMDRAAGTLFEALKSHFGKDKHFVILCGKGNNGGDGWALAKRLSEICERTTCISALGEPSTEDARYFFDKCNEILTRDVRRCLTVVDADKNIDAALSAISCADVIVDAVFGTGFSGEIIQDSTVARLIVAANGTSAFRLSADIPGGVNALSGTVSEICFEAEEVVTFARAKPGLYSYPARSKCGKITVADIGIPDSVFESFSQKYEISDEDTVKSYLPKRFADSNKGSYGRLLCVCGSDGMPGAARLAVSGALRTGVGLVCAASTPSVIAALSQGLSEPIYMQISDSDKDTDRLVEYSKKCSAVLIGCGLGVGEEVTRRVSRLVRECACPIILDADGINAICGNINILTEAKGGILLTPHPLEFSRLSGLSVEKICKSRLEVAEDFSRKYGCTLLLKGAGTIISHKGERVCINTTGNSALSKGGSGDVLSGMIASFAAQGAELYESAVVAAYLHGSAGDLLSRTYSEYGILPSDLPLEAARILSFIVR